MGQGVEIGIGADALVHAPAEKRVDRPVAGLAENVPAGDLKPGKGTHDGEVGPLREARAHEQATGLVGQARADGGHDREGRDQAAHGHDRVHARAHR